jgi:hypothetical protein
MSVAHEQAAGQHFYDESRMGAAGKKKQKVRRGEKNMVV